jgi:hypothetical protein
VSEPFKPHVTKQNKMPYKMVIFQLLALTIWTMWAIYCEKREKEKKNLTRRQGLFLCGLGHFSQWPTGTTRSSSHLPPPQPLINKKEPIP